MGGPIIKDKLFFFGAYQRDRFLTSSPGPVQVESPQFRVAATAAFPNSVAALLYKNFAPSTKGTPLMTMTLREYVTNSGGSFSGSGFSRFADYLCPGSLDPLGRDATAAVGLSDRFAQLFGVEQTDIDKMNLAQNHGGCLGGSPFLSPQAGTFNRDDTFLEQAISVNKSQVEGNLFNGNEASLRLDFNSGVRPVQLGKVKRSVHWQPLQPSRLPESLYANNTQFPVQLHPYFQPNRAE